MGVHVLQRASATGAEMRTFRIGARFAWSNNFLNLTELGALSGLFDSDGNLFSTDGRAIASQDAPISLIVKYFPWNEEKLILFDINQYYNWN